MKIVTKEVRAVWLSAKHLFSTLFKVNFKEICVYTAYEQTSKLGNTEKNSAFWALIGPSEPQIQKFRKIEQGSGIMARCNIFLLDLIYSTYSFHELLFLMIVFFVCINELCR